MESNAKNVVTREAAQRALEALEDHAKQYPHMQKGYTLDATTALRAALAEQLGYKPELERFAHLVRAQAREEVANMVSSCDPRATPKGIAAAIRQLKEQT